METEFTVLTLRAEVCVLDRLAAVLETAGWTARVLAEYGRAARVLVGGPLPAESVLYAWPADTPHADRLAARFPAGGEIDVDELPEAGLAACAVSVSRLETPEEIFEREEWADAATALPADKLAVLRGAECRYELSTWPLEGQRSNRLIRAVARALARETGGVVFGPTGVQAWWAEEM